MPLTKRRSPPRRKDRRERSRSFSPYTRRESRHHTDDYHAYSRPSQSRSTSANQAYHRSRSPVGHMTSAPPPAGGARPHARRNQYSPSARHEVRSSREHSQRSFSPPPRHSSLSSPKQRSRHTRDDFDNSRSFVGQSDNRERWMSESRMRNTGSSSHRYGGSESIYAPDRGEPRNWERLERVQHNPDDLRHSIGPRYSSRKKSGFPEGSYYDGDYESKGRDSKYSKHSPERLPDFSKRPDKYQYEEWREHPEMVPRGSNYYEHDTRPEVDMMPSQSRGTGRFRSRKDGLLPHPFRPFRSRGTFKPRLTTHSFTTRRTFGSRTLDRFRTRSRGNISLRNRPRGRGGLSDPPAAGSDWKESSFGKSSEKSASDK